MTMTCSSSVGHGGYVCAKCGWLVPYGNAHSCATARARGVALPYFGTWTLTGSPCPDCGLQVEAGSQHDCPSAHSGPETPLAEATAKLCGWLAQAQAWLERNRL